MNKQKSTILVASIALVAIFAGIWTVNHSQKAANPTPSPASTQVGASLLVKEWAAKLPLSSAITDAYYTYNAGSGEIFISTKQLDTLLSHIQGCSSGLHGLYYKKTSTSPLTLTEQHRIEPMCAVPANSETEQIGTIQAGIRQAAQAAASN